MFSHLLITTPRDGAFSFWRASDWTKICLVQDESSVFHSVFLKKKIKKKILALTFKSKLLRHESEDRVTDNLKKPDK